MIIAMPREGAVHVLNMMIMVPKPYLATRGMQWMLRALASFNMLSSLFADYVGNKNDRDATDTAQDVLLAATIEWLQEVRKHRQKLKLHVYCLVSQPRGPWRCHD